MKWNTQYWLSPRVMIRTSFVLVIPFILLALASFYSWGWLRELDAEIGLDIIEDQNRFLTPLFLALSQLGGVFVTILLLLVVGIYVYRWKKRPDLAIWLTVTVALGGGAVNQFFKFLFKRSRPAVEQLTQQGGYSFPSGHSMGSIILYGAIVFLIVQLARRRAVKWAALFVAAVLTTAIGISRIYLGVHYPSDVIGGFSLGAAWLAACIGTYGMWKNNLERKQRE